MRHSNLVSLIPLVCFVPPRMTCCQALRARAFLIGYCFIHQSFISICLSIIASFASEACHRILPFFTKSRVWLGEPQPNSPITPPVTDCHTQCWLSPLVFHSRGLLRNSPDCKYKATRNNFQCRNPAARPPSMASAFLHCPTPHSVSKTAGCFGSYLTN